MVPPNLKFCFISRNECPESQQKHELKNRFLRALLCSNDVLNPGYNRKSLIRKSTSILDSGCFSSEQLFLPVQWTACKRCQCRSIDKVALSRVIGILSTLDQLHCLWGTNCFGNGTRQYSNCLYQSRCLLIIFSYQPKLSISHITLLISDQSFQCLFFVAFHLELV